MITLSLQHWRVETDNNNIAWWWLDKKDTSTNTLDKEVMEELSQLIDNVRINPATRAIIIASAKKNGFIAGADIKQFTAFTSLEDALIFIRRCQTIFDNLASLTIPTVAMIEGFCLGGGFELALSCRYRVAEDGQKTRIGLPEVKLGIHPGWGGTIRLPLLIGAPKAMDLMLSGRAVNARTAFKMGMIDASVPKRHLLRAAVSYALKSPAKRPLNPLINAINLPFIRPLFARLLRTNVAKHANPRHYPAPYAIIDNWVRDGATSSHAMENEARSIGELIVGETAQNLIRVFFLQERLKGLAKATAFKAKHVHVVGAGVMGGDIAAWCALRGLKVTLQDREPKFIAPAIKRAYILFKGKLKEPRLVQAAMDRLLPDIEGHGIPQADVIIEAASENVAVKQALFKSLELRARSDAILATNTSSIPLSDIYEAMQNPARLIGIHFFNPVAKLPLIEIVHDTKTSADIINQSLAFARQIDKLPLPVTSTPGFLVNRILMPYMMEAMALHQEGFASELIDKAAVDFGMPMGPIELADTVGLDICLSVAKELSADTDSTLFTTLEKMIASGHLGRKSGKGFYVYKDGKTEKEKITTSPNAIITERLVLRMLNECMSCLREKVVTDADLLDAGMIFGTGFAPFRGGPLHYAQKEGYEAVRIRLQHLQTACGERFKPDAGWGNYPVTLPG